MKSIVHAKKKISKKKRADFCAPRESVEVRHTNVRVAPFRAPYLKSSARRANINSFFAVFLRNVPRHIVNLLHTLGTSPRCILILNFQISIQRKWWNSWGKTCNTTGSGCWHLRGCTSTSKSSIRKKYKASQSVLPISLATSWVKPSWET